MKNIGGIWLPDHETHLVAWMQQKNQVVDGKLTYQWDKIQLALSHVRQWRVALDIGGHCGLWSMHLAKRFRQVVAFEPVAEHRECWKKNVTATTAVLEPFALGEVAGSVAIHTTNTSSGDSWVSGEGDIPLKRLDDLDFADVDIDFIKVDCEGYELHALRGGEQLLRRCRPTVIVEQKPGRAKKFGLPDTGAVDYLQSLGAVLRAEKSGDFVLSWDE